MVEDMSPLRRGRLGLGDTVEYSDFNMNYSTDQENFSIPV
jgi:hypothetical protein